ncbi:MAG TPA: sigma-70 family RNA polymerase sigma factor [Anaerolineae bacterium]|nr:sigma-70 family RNA polymerase sigma factor [Anaerolineae bacterium]HQI85343.1 sigma-70 family RNA polymerase sigma factor [Anaerolineae bacterium]
MITQPRLIERLAAATQPVDWDAVFTALLPKVYRYFCYRVGAGPLAEDLTATTFEKAWTKRMRYRQDLSSFTTWVFTIARNVATDHFRTARATAPLADAEAAPADVLSPEAVFEQREHFARLAQHIGQLPEREQEILALKYGAGLGQQEIANLTGLTASHVGVIVHRAVKQLRSTLEADDER